MEEDYSVHYRFLPWYESFSTNLSILRDGGFAGAMNDTLSSFGLEIHSRAIAGSAKVCWVLDIHHHDYSFPSFLSILDLQLRCVNEIQALLHDWLESGRRTLVYSIWKSCVRHGWEISPEEEPSEPSEPFVVVVSAVVLLALVYHYLTGNADRRGGSKAYSRSSLDFRDSYVAIVLFLGAYVWIKFREAALKGAHRREFFDEQGRFIKEVYEARLTPPTWNGEKVPRLDLGQFATQQEAHNKFLIAAFYYGRNAGLVDGWFQVPSMSAEERSLTGNKKRKWVICQAKKVYEDFEKKAKAEAALVKELLEACEGQATPGHDEVNVDFSVASLLNSAEHQQPALASQVEDSNMGVTILDNHRLNCASHSFDGTPEVLAFPNDHSPGSEEGPALPVPQLRPNAESRTSLNGSDPLDLLQTHVHNLQQQTDLQQQQICYQQQQIFLQQQQIRDFGAQILQFRNQQGIQQQQQQLAEFNIQNPQWPYQLYFQQQQVEVLNQGVPSSEVWMEQSMQQQYYSGVTTPPPDGGEA